MAENQELAEDTRAKNWLDLASHFQAKVNKRTAEVSFLQTKAGFLIAAAVVAFSAIAALPKFDDSLAVGALILAALCAFASLVVAIISMQISKSSTPLNPDQMILELTERPNMSREDFSNWLAKSYAAANTAFNKEYGQKYNQQIAAAILLVVAFALVLILKGVKTYV